MLTIDSIGVLVNKRFVWFLDVLSDTGILLNAVLMYLVFTGKAKYPQYIKI